AIRSATRNQNRPRERLNQLAESIRIRTPARTFSQMRGTPKRMVGCTSRRFAGTVSMDSAKCTWIPEAAENQVVKIRSATWHSGRYDRLTSEGDGGGEVNPPPSISTLMQ